MTKATRGRYTLEFKQEAVRLVESGQYVVDICELPEGYDQEMTITGVSINVNESLGLGIVVAAQKQVAGANSPVIINSPFLSEFASSEGGGPQWPPYVAELVAKLEAEAELYRIGKRAQQELPIGGSAAA